MHEIEQARQAYNYTWRTQTVKDKTGQIIFVCWLVNWKYEERRYIVKKCKPKYVINYSKD